MNGESVASVCHFNNNNNNQSLRLLNKVIPENGFHGKNGRELRSQLKVNCIFQSHVNHLNLGSFLDNIVSVAQASKHLGRSYYKNKQN